MNTHVKEEKKLLRDKYREAREFLSIEDKLIYDHAINECFINTIAYKNAEQILLYASLEKEINTSEIFKKSIEDGRKCLFPKCTKLYEMDFYYVSELNQLKKGIYNITEPISDELYVSRHFDVCVIPAFTYDASGYRLGYGKGYYDRFLSSFNGIKVGFCYNSFLEKALPRGKFDIKIDILITEKGIIPLQNLKNNLTKLKNKTFTYQGKNK